MAVDVETRVREICRALPEVVEKTTHGAPGFFVRKQFVMLWPNGHHDRDVAHLWCAAEPGAQEALIATSDRYFRPPYVGHRGWVGVRLDGDVDWQELAELLRDAYLTVAPARLAKLTPLAGAPRGATGASEPRHPRGHDAPATSPPPPPGAPRRRSRRT